MDKKAKEEEGRQKELVKGDPAIMKLSRKERRKASQNERERERESARVSGSRGKLQMKLSRKERRKASQNERERERESACVSGSRVLHHDPYRPSSGEILEVLHIDLTSGVYINSERNAKLWKPSTGLSGLAKLSKPSGSRILAKQLGAT